MKINSVGVLGAGVMGRGVSLNLALSGFETILVDISEKTLEHSKKEILRELQLQKLFTKNNNSEPFDVVMGRIRFTTDYDSLGTCDFVVENVTEKWDIKKQVYNQIDNICSDNCIFAANTSCVSISKIAAETNRPDKIIGIHFMNPVYLKEAVEVIKGYYTSEECIQTTVSFLKTLNKKAIIVNDLPGFVTNRISHLFMNEAAFVVQDNVATVAQVDEIFKKCYGHKMGPLETADLIGLDTVVNSIDVLYESYQDSKFRCCPMLRKMVDAGLLGRKSGKGFYEYK